MAREVAIESVEQCSDWVLSGARPRTAFRIGTEYERLVVDASTGASIPYEGPRSVRAMFDLLMRKYAWQPLMEGDNPIALGRSGASISLEPAGQFELSGAPLAHIEGTAAERDHHLAELDDIAHQLGLRYVFVGMHPFDSPESAPKVPKKRYDHMRAWMPNVGTMGLEMMHLTCTVQANLDFADRDEAMEMFRLAYLLTPVWIALFANSPWKRGRPTGMASSRAHVWTDVDRARCQPGNWVFDPAAQIEDYVQWALDVPMYFVWHQDDAGCKQYTAPTRPGLTFRQFLADGDRGRRPTLTDFELHMSTLFPDVRLKRYIEVRAADCVPPALLPALPALCKGLLYDVASRRAALALLRDGDVAVHRAALRAAACQHGLDGRVGDLELSALAVAMVDLARCGLERLEAEFGRDGAAVAAIDAIDAIARGEQAPLWREVDRKLRAQPSLLALAEPLQPKGRAQGRETQGAGGGQNASRRRPATARSPRR